MSFDGYVRISRVGGRSGPGFIGPQMQRETIARIAAAKGVELGEIVDERDVSGGTRIEERKLGRLVERVERGESDGVIVWKLSRFSRSLLDCVETATRITRAGGRLIAEDFDSAQPMAKGMLGLLAGMAEEELEARRQVWDESRRRSVERGVPNGRAPFGYRKRPDGRLEVVERETAKVREAFRLRAEGMSFSEIGRRCGWSHSTCRQVLSNVAYLGVARSGAYVNENAHPAIVTRELWGAAQAGRTRTPAATGALTAERLLQGLARCAGCGRTLKIVHRQRSDGTRVSSYFCKNTASEECLSRAYVHADELDGFVADWFARALETAPRMVDVVRAGRDLECAQTEQAAAEEQLYAYAESADAMDKTLFQRGLAARQRRVDDVRAQVAQLAARLSSIPAGGRLIALWERFEPAERREVLAGFLGRVTVERGASANLAPHVVIAWADGSVAHDEGRVRVAAA